MKIWVIGRSYPQASNNMQGSFELEQAKMLSKRGNDVGYIACVFHPFKKVRRWGFCHWREEQLGVFTFSQFYTIERMKLHLEPFKTAVWRKFLTQVEQETGLPDVIHIHYPANITVAKVVLEYQKKGVKIVCTEHWSQVQQNVIDRYERKQLTMYADHADAFLCVSEPLREAVKNITGTKRDLYIVPNVINDAFHPSAIEHTGKKFVVVGALFPNKQFDKVIRALAACSEKDMTLTVVGGGPESKHLESLAAELKITDRVTFTGKLSREETANVISQSDVLVCYSKFETFGVPIIESWACGLPVIATTAAAVMEVWNDKLGIQVSPNHLEELQSAMQYVYHHYKQYDSEYISKYAKEQYSEGTIYQTLMGYYRCEDLI